MFGPFASACVKLRDPTAFDAEISFLSPQSLKDLVDAETGDTGLHAAAAACNSHACQRLLQLGVDVNAVNKRGVTALCLAAGEGGLDTVQLLVSSGADVDLCGTPDASARGANPFNLRGLSNPGVHSGVLAFTPLQAACAGNHPGVVQYLCGKSVGLTPLHFACMALGNEAAMVLLEHAGPAAIASVDELGRSCLAVTSTIDGGVFKAKLADIASQAGVAVPAGQDALTSEDDSTDGRHIHDSRAVLRGKGPSTVGTLPSVSRFVAPQEAQEGDDGDDLDRSMGDERPTRRRNTAGSDVFDSPPRQSGFSDPMDDETPSHSRPIRLKHRAPGVDTSGEAGDSDRAVASPHDTSPKHILPVTIAKVFGGEVYQKLSSNNWKEREEALMQADIVLSSPHLLHSDGALVFEAGCELLCTACEDKVAQIFYAAIPVLHTLLSGRTNAKIPLDGQDTYARGGVSLDLESSTDAVSNALIQLMPELERLLSSLVAKAASATERTSDMASQALVHVACHTPIGPRCVAQVIMGAKSSDAGGGWRLLVGRCGVLEIIIGEFGVGVKSGLSLEGVTAVALEALSNPSVKARHAGTTLAVALTPTVIGAAHEAHLSEADALDALSTFVTSYFSDVKPLLQKALLTKMSEAARKHLGLSEFGAPSSARKPSGKARDANRPPTPVTDSKSVSIGTLSSGHVSSPVKTKVSTSAVKSGDGGSVSDGDSHTDPKGIPGTSGSWLDVDLSLEDCTIAYAEPLSKELEDSLPAIAMTCWLGNEATRAAFSHDWKARRSVVMACAKKLSEPHPRVDSDVIVAVVSLVKRTLPETVMSVSLAAEVLVWRLIRALSSDDTCCKDFVSEVPGLLPLIVGRLGDGKSKVRATTVDLIARVSQQYFVGLRPVLAALLSPEAVQSKRDNVHHISAVLNLLIWLSKRHGMSSTRMLDPATRVNTGGLQVVTPLGSSDENVPIKDALDVAVIALQHRDKTARRAALKMFQCATASTTAGPVDERLIVVGQVMATLPSSVRSKLTKKLSELAEARQNAMAKKAGFKGLDDIVVGTKSPTKADPSKTGTSDAGRLSPWATGDDPDAVVDDDNQAGGVSAVVASGKLPDAPMLDGFELEEKDQLIGIIGEKAVRCFCSKVWTHRHAAIALVTRRVMDCVIAVSQRGDDDVAALSAPDDSQCDIPPLPPRSAKIFMQLASMFEQGLWDSVATVFLASVELMMAVTQNYLPMVSGKQLIVRAGLQPSIRAIVARLGDTKVRVRETCEVTLATLSSLSTVTPSMVFEALIDDIGGTGSGKQDDTGPSAPQSAPSPNAIIGRLRVLRGMIQSFGATTSGIIASPDGSTASLLDVTDMMCQFQQLFEARHVPIRNEAQSLYVAVYESMVGRYGMAGANVMNGFIGGLRPAQRSIVAAAVADFNRSAGITVGASSEEPPLSPVKALSSSQKLSASQLVSAPLSSGTSLLGDKDTADIVRAAIGIELAGALSSDAWQDRQKGLWTLAQAIVSGKVPLIPKASPPFWETILGVIKSALLDPASQVNVAVFDVVLAVTPDIESTQVGGGPTSKCAIPWDLWDVQLPLGSLVKTLFGKLGDIRRRVVDVTRRIIVRLAQVNKNCLSVIAKALCGPIALPTSDSVASVLGMRSVLTITTRLRVLADILECPVVASGTYPLPFDALLKWLTPLMASRVSTVLQLAKYCAELLLTGPDADLGDYTTSISTFLSSCDAATREYLDAAMTGTSQDDNVKAGEFGVAGFGLSIATHTGLSARSEFTNTARSVDSDGSWEGLGVNGAATATSQLSASAVRSVSPTFVIQQPARSPLVPPGSPIMHNPLGSPTGASSPLRRPAQQHRRVDSAGPSSSAFGNDGASSGIALSGEPARRVPLAGRRALSAKDVPFSTFENDGLSHAKPSSHITVADLPSLTLPSRAKASEASWLSGPLVTSPITTSDDVVGFQPRSSSSKGDSYASSWSVSGSGGTGGGVGYGGIAGRSVTGGATGPSLYSGTSSTVKAALAAQSTPTKPRLPASSPSPHDPPPMFPSPSPPAIGRSQFRVTPTEDQDDGPLSFTVSSGVTRDSPNNRHRTLRLS